MSVEVIFTVFFIVFLAELGDKTQLLLLTLSTHHAPRKVFWGAFSAILILNIIAVALGTFLYHLIPMNPLRWLSGGLLLLFGILIFLRRSPSVREEKPAERSFIKSFSLIILMELGDKTQLSLIALAVRYGNPLSVFFGGTLALGLSFLLAVFIGSRLARLIPYEKIRSISGVIFIVFGLALIMGIA